MKVACVGGGPAGQYLTILLKTQDPSHHNTVHERDPEGSTNGSSGANGSSGSAGSNRSTDGKDGSK